MDKQHGNQEAWPGRQQAVLDVDWMDNWLNVRSGGPARMLGPDAQLARELLLEKFPAAAGYVNIASLGNGQQRELAAWMQRLSQSRVRQYIAAGPAALPEVATRMHWLPGLFSLAEHPRSRPKLIAHLAKYLECYSGEEARAGLFVQLRAFTLVGAALLSCGIGYAVRRFSAAQPAITVDYSGMLQMYILAGGAIIAIMLLRLRFWFWNSEALLRHLALYLYLRECDEAEALAAQGGSDAGR